MLFLWAGGGLFCLQAVPSANLSSMFTQNILPYYDAAPQAEFSGQDGVPIRYVVFKSTVSKPGPALVFLTGRNESTRKYAELFWDLQQSGFTIYAMDHRGQGYSGRLLDDPAKGYVDDWTDYVADVQLFMERVVLPGKHSSLTLSAHSMGGCIAAAYVEIHPGIINRIVLFSPMLAINTGALPESLVYIISGTMKLLGLGSQYAPGQKAPVPGGGELSQVKTTRNALRYASHCDIITENPALQLGGATAQWVRTCMDMGWFVREHASSINIPVLVMSAGDDQLVQLAVQREFVSKIPLARQVIWWQARHELLSELDEVRNEAIARLVDFVTAPQ